LLMYVNQRAGLQSAVASKVVIQCQLKSQVKDRVYQ
jgi:hypothetical protein